MFQYEYERPSLTGDSIIVKDGKVLLVLRSKWPYEGQWALPGGFVNPGEDPIEAAIRELREETHVTSPVTPELVGVFGKAGRDPRGWVVAVAFVTDLTGYEVQPIAGDDAADVMWVPMTTDMKLAFDHNDILTAAIRVLDRRRL